MYFVKMSSDERQYLKPLNLNINSSTRRKTPDEKCDDKLSPESKREDRNLTVEEMQRKRRKVSFGNVEDDSANVVKHCLSAVYEDCKNKQIPKETIKERWKRVSRLALKKQRILDTRLERCKEPTKVSERKKKEHDKYLEKCSAEQIDTIIRLIFRWCPREVTYEEKLQSIRSYRDRSFKKDSRKWLHKSTKRAKRARDDFDNPDIPNSKVPPKKAISQEEFRKLLEVHEDERVAEYLADAATNLDTNSSSFDRINLGPFYEEHMRQKELLVEKEDWSERQDAVDGYNVRRSVRYGDLSINKRTGSLPDLTTEKSESEEKQIVESQRDIRLSERDLERHYSTFNSSDNKFFEDHWAVKINRSLSDSMLHKVYSQNSTNSGPDPYESRGMLACVESRSASSLHLPSVPVTEVNTNYCVTPILNPSDISLKHLSCKEPMESCVTWEEIDRNAMARYTFSPPSHICHELRSSRIIHQDQFSIPDSCSDTSVERVCNNNARYAHSLSPSSVEENPRSP